MHRRRSTVLFLISATFVGTTTARAQPAPTREHPQPAPTREHPQPAPTREHPQPAPTREHPQPAPTREDPQPQLEIDAQRLRKHAQELEKAEKWQECGDVYFELYKRAPKAQQADELLYNSGVCYEGAKSLGVAAMQFDRLARNPRSPLASRALMRSAEIFATMGSFREAAQRLERFFDLWPGERQSPDALSTAALYYAGIDDVAKAMAVTEKFVRTFRRRLPKEAATAAYSTIGLARRSGKPEQELRVIDNFLKDFASTASNAQRVAAFGRMGELLWHKSCPLVTASPWDACAKASRPSKTPRCQAVSNPVAVRRNPKLVAEARKAFAQAKKIAAAKSTATADDEAWTKHWARAASFYEAEESFESLMAVKEPKGLNFDPTQATKTKDSVAKFQKWIEKLTSAGKKTHELYALVLDGFDSWSVASAARSGQAMEFMASAIRSTEIPASARTGAFAADKKKAYCDTVQDEARPLHAKAVEAFEYCLESAQKLDRFNPWGRLCERELIRHTPGTFPKLSEIFNNGGRVGPVVSTSAVLATSSAPPQ